MSSKTIYKKEFIPDIGIGTSFLCIPYSFFQDNTSPNSIYKNAIDWIEKNRNTIEIVETITEDYSHYNLYMKEGKVIIFYRIKI